MGRVKIQTFTVFGHEYRTSIGLIGLMFMTTGIIDALLDDFTLKYFLTLSFLMIFITGIIYELMWYPTPLSPWFETILMVAALFTASFGVHGATWLFISILMGREIGSGVWLAPNIIVSKQLFYAITFTCLAIYLSILILVNLVGDE